MALLPPSIWRSPLVWISGMALVFLLWCWRDSGQYFSKGVLHSDPYASRFVTNSGGRLAFWKKDLDPKSKFYELTITTSTRERYTGATWEYLSGNMPLSSWPPVHWKLRPAGFLPRVQVWSVSWWFITLLHLLFSGSLIYARRRRILKAMQVDG